jgi:hypothetical protein
LCRFLFLWSISLSLVVAAVVPEAVLVVVVLVDF